MALWMQDIYAFIDGQAGKTLPWPSTEVVKLPANWIFPGTAGHGIVLLAESYGYPGAHYFEETLAHETSHEWWGILVSPTDYGTSRWLVEGLATVSQIDYAADVQNPNLDREAYLTRRYREHDIMMRYTAQGPIPAVVPAFPIDAGENDTLWAYIRGSAALDTLRVLVGEDVFADTLRAWASGCAQTHCDTLDFKDVLETTSGQDLTAAFDAYVFGAPFPEPQLSFTQDGDELQVTATGMDVPLPLDLWILHDDRTQSRARVTLEPDVAASIPVNGSVRSVRPNPRHDAMVRSRSLTEGDVTFSGDVDGFDVITCARAAGTSIQQVPNGEGLMQIDLDFLPRCDRNGDGVIDQSDTNDILDRMGATAP
jgi:aminopeptidase N